MTRPIYLDYNATTPVAPEVVQAMLPFLTERFGNPSSAHAYGGASHAAVERARVALAGLLNAPVEGVVFTSGGTESNNLALRGVAEQSLGERRRVIISAVEHPSITKVAEWLGGRGFSITTLPVDGAGRVHAADLEALIGPDVLLVSVMHANNEVGTVQPIAELAAIAHARGALLHTDAAQSVGKITVDVLALGADLVTVAGHKLYAPKGIGALYVRPGLALAPLHHGAGQERGVRPGTEPVAQIVALGEAARLADLALASESGRLRSLRDRLEEALGRELGDGSLRRNGHPEYRLPNTLSLSLHGVRADAVLAAIAGEVAASAGSACHAHDVRLSPVLRAMGVEPEWGMGTLRLSVGRYTTAEQVERAAGIIAAAARQQLAEPATARPGN